ncbi:MAG: valine--tRNA ligase [Candidatus Diapherotrites archaeon CG11_big_fil_rev_8_21_14_0_20_37_9]|nr:MAG: valine--tRNA ligase [Candidatus Diapherotrites archaeon CG11_big_fil_rev_8_21_14_0_20_37_9]
MGKGEGPDFKGIEAKWQKHWVEQKTCDFDHKRDGPIYSIDTPPPTVSGRMHLGHAFSYSQADFIARYKRMQGFNVFYPFGLDDNGLATERLVEKSRKIRAKDFTRDEFIKICLEETKKHEDIMLADFKALGLSVDWTTLYRTIDEHSRKTSQLSFIEIYNMQRAYRKEAPSMWCPTCETAIAQAELEDVKLDSTFNDIIFKVDGKDMIIATTRPELLSSCVAVFIHPSDKRKNDLLGKKAVVPLFNYEVPILEDVRVDPEKGSGIVMCCTFGDQTDMEWYFAHNLPLKMSISPDGRMTNLAQKYEGKKIKEARKEIIEDLKSAGLLINQKPIKHAVNVHERCKTEIEILHTKQWFLKYLDLKEEFLKQGNELKWYPKHMRVRFDNWIKGLQWDWSLSRQRFFGVPFPVWYCKECNAEIIASEEQLPVDPIEDKPAAGKCNKCGCTEFIPEKDVLDTWMTSSLTPQINSKWASDKKFHKKLFPMSVRPQAHDIITLWAFNTVVKAYLHEKSLPWNDIMISGHALDSKGRKMSKSLGNVVNPVEMVEKYSADMLRYWAATGNLGDDLPFQEKEFITGKKFLMKLMNASRFVAMKSEGIKPGIDRADLRVVDKWILSKLAKVVKESTNAFEKYEYSKALASARNFFWLEFADYYIEEVKYRVYSEGKDSETAKKVLLEVITTILKLFAPFAPHVTEEIYQENFKPMMKTKSIHTEKWPSADAELIDEESEKLGETAKIIIAEIRKHKSTNSLAMNAEIAKVVVYGERSIEQVIEDVKNIMNVKEISIKDGKGGIEVNETLSLDIQ